MKKHLPLKIIGIALPSLLIIVAIVLLATGTIELPNNLTGTITNNPKFYTNKEGYNYLNFDIAKNQIKQTELTEVNWKDFFTTQLIYSDGSKKDKNGYSMDKIVSGVTVAIKEQYVTGMNDVYMVLRNKLSGVEFTYEYKYWSENMSYEYGKIYTLASDENDNLVKYDFSFDNYECLFVHGVVYEYNLPDEVLYCNKHDNVVTSLELVPYSKDEADESTELFVLVQTEDGGDDFLELSLVEYNGLGSYVYGFEGFIS